MDGRIPWKQRSWAGSINVGRHSWKLDEQGCPGQKTAGMGTPEVSITERCSLPGPQQQHLSQGFPLSVMGGVTRGIMMVAHHRIPEG